jgi:hypothetical protein
MTPKPPWRKFILRHYTRALEFSPDGKQLLATTNSGVQLFDARDLMELR